MSTIPGVLSSRRSDNDGESKMQLRKGITRKTRRGSIQDEMQSKVVKPVFEIDELGRPGVVATANDDGQNQCESLDSNPNLTSLTSPASSSITAKENSPPKKRGRGKNKRSMGTYSPPKTRERRSSSNTITPSKQTKNYLSTIINSVVSEDESSVGTGNGKDGEDAASCSSDTITSNQGSSTSTIMQGRRSGRIIRNKVIKEVVDKMWKKSRTGEQGSNDDTTAGGESVTVESGEATPNRKTTKDVDDGDKISDKKTETMHVTTEITEHSREDDGKLCTVKIEPEGSDSDNDTEEDSASDVENADEGVYVVERIDAKRVVNGTCYYFIKWKGWNESSNTWEPLENLGGCSKLLQDFEKRYAEQKASRGSTAAGGGRSKRKDGDQENDESESTEGPQTNMRSYVVFTEWPQDKEPISVEGVINVDGVLTYVVKRKTRLGPNTLKTSNAVFVHAESFRIWFPQLVIKFYESRVVWAKNPKHDDEQANVASQIPLLHQKAELLVGSSNDIDGKLLEDCKNIKQIGDEKHLELETQVIDERRLSRLMIENGYFQH